MVQYPKCLYSAEGKSVIVHSKEEHDALIGDWRETPAAFEKEVQDEVGTESGDQSTEREKESKPVEEETKTPVEPPKEEVQPEPEVKPEAEVKPIEEAPADAEQVNEGSEEKTEVEEPAQKEEPKLERPKLDDMSMKDIKTFLEEKLGVTEPLYKYDREGLEKYAEKVFDEKGL